MQLQRTPQGQVLHLRRSRGPSGLAMLRAAAATASGKRQTLRQAQSSQPLRLKEAQANLPPPRSMSHAEQSAAATVPLAELAASARLSRGASLLLEHRWRGARCCLKEGDGRRGTAAAEVENDREQQQQHAAARP